MRETHQVRLECRNDTTPNSFVESAGAFETWRNIFFRRPPPFPSRQLPKPAKHVVLRPTSAIPYDTRHDARTYAVPSQLRPCD